MNMNMKQTISKKIISALSICSLLAMASSCSDSIVENQGHEDRGVKMTFMAAFEGNETRASIVEGTPAGVKDIVWNDGDEISVLTNESGFENVKFTINPSCANTKSGSFTGTTAAGAANYAGLYPYQGYVKLNEANYTQLQNVTVPSLQHATDNTFDPKAAPMIGVTTKSEQTFNFKNVCAFVKVTPKAACKSITLEATGGTYLSGSVNVDYKNGDPTCTNPNPSVSPLSSKVTLVGDIKADNTYYIAVLPQTIASGNLKITYQTSDKYLRATVKKDVVLERSKYYDVSATAPSSFEQGTALYVDLGVSVLWATRNLGASKASEFGTPYAWGEIAGLGESDDANKMNIIYNAFSPVKTSFSKENYKYGDGTSYDADNYHMKKYPSKYPTVDEEGQPTTGDNLTTLVSADDAANVAWNDGCRMPSNTEIQELINNCHWEYYESGAIKGYWVYRNSTEANHAYKDSDPHIFLPIADYWSNTVYDIPNSGKTCYYEKAYGISVKQASTENPKNVNVDGIDRYKGIYIRPVKSRANNHS